MFSVSDLSLPKIKQFLTKYGLNIRLIPDGATIPYSFWGCPEAGRRQHNLYARADTPLHSLLHETAHYVCLPPHARERTETDAKGSAVQEAACCYLQLLWSDQFSHSFTFARHCHDMDQWGYSFRLGSAKRWFEEDAEDARDWLISEQLIHANGEVTWQLRQSSD